MRLATILALIALPLPGLTQAPRTAADLSEVTRSLGKALDSLLGQEPDGPRHVILLIDATASLAKAGFAPAVKAALQRNAKALAATSVTVARVGAKKPVLAPTNDAAAITAAVRRVLAAPSNEFQNVYASLRRVAASLAVKRGERRIVLVTLDNGDAEDNLEGTVARLGRAGVRVDVITSEAYLADSYWAAHPYEKAPRGSKLTGGDAPFTDLPWGWQFQIQTINELTPSGFGTYGLNRVAAATGGKVVLWAAPAGRHSCAVYGYCPFCSGDHIATDEVFWDARVRRFAAPVVARKVAYQQASADPWFRAVRKAWRSAAKAGLVRSQPPRLAGTAASPSRIGRWLPLTISLSFERNAVRATKALGKCAKILSTLEADLARLTAAQGSPRHQAIAGLTRILLQLQRVNLVTFRAWCTEIAPALAAKTPAPAEPPDVPDRNAGRRPAGIGWTNLSLCHGVKPFFDVDLPGGAPLRQELTKLDAMITRYLASHAHTPFAIAVHRLGIARFTFTYPGIARPIPRKRPKSKRADDPTTVTGGRGRPSRTGSTGRPTGPTTGGGR